MKIRSLALLAATLTCAAACSKAPEPTAAPTSTPAPAASPTPTPAARPTAATPTPVAAAPTPAAPLEDKPRLVYVGSLSTTKVLGFDGTGAPAAGFTAPTGFGQAQAMVFNPANNTLYVADTSNGTLRTFDAMTGAEKSLGFANVTDLGAPRGLALAAGKLFVADTDHKNIRCFDAATGAPVTKGFTSPPAINRPVGVAVRDNTLYVSEYLPVEGAGKRVGAYDLATGAPVPGFTPLQGGDYESLAVAGDVLFVGERATQRVGEYNATTGAEFNANFVGGVAPWGLAVLGHTLFVVDYTLKNVGAFGFAATPTANNGPTSFHFQFIDKLEQPCGIAVVP